MSTWITVQYKYDEQIRNILFYLDMNKMSHADITQQLYSGSDSEHVSESRQMRTLSTKY